MVFTFPLSSSYRGIQLHRKSCDVCSQVALLVSNANCPLVLFSWVLYEHTESGRPRPAEPMSHSNLISEISGVLQIKADLHEEQRNLSMVLRAEPALLGKYIRGHQGLIMRSFESRNTQVLLRTPVLGQMDV